MKATIEFNLPEDQEEYNRARKAGLYLSALETIFEHVRDLNKYHNPHKSADEAITDILQVILAACEQGSLLD